MKTRLPPEIFGDALMVLEFLHAFGELFDLQDEFPEGVSLGKYSITCCALQFTLPFRDSHVIAVRVPRSGAMKA